MAIVCSNMTAEEKVAVRAAAAAAFKASVLEMEQRAAEREAQEAAARAARDEKMKTMCAEERAIYSLQDTMGPLDWSNLHAEWVESKATATAVRESVVVVDDNEISVSEQSICKNGTVKINAGSVRVGGLVNERSVLSLSEEWSEDGELYGYGDRVFVFQTAYLE